VSEDPNHPWGSGRTTFTWTPEISAIVQRVLRRWPHVSANSYVCHPWCGWSRWSVDFWGDAGRGDALPEETGYEIRRFLMDLQGKPLIRHTIFKRQLWTRWGGYSLWTRHDHEGRLRHLHVTYLKD
jgi:hypothetical protein